MSCNPFFGVRMKRIGWVIALAAAAMTPAVAAPQAAAPAAAASAIAHPIRFILTPKIGLQDGSPWKCSREIGGLIGAGSPALKGG